MRIVVVEDEAKTRRGVINLIKKINPDYQVVGEAANGADGLKIITTLKPDLVIVDVRMPQLNGLEMLDKLKEEKIRHKTVILSGYSDFEFAQKAIKVGVNEYLLKPITVEDIQKTLLVIEKELETEKQTEHSRDFFTVEHILQNILLEETHNVADLQDYLVREHGIQGNQSFALVMTISNGEIPKKDLKLRLKNYLDQNQDLKYFIMDITIYHETIILLPLQSDLSTMEVFFEEVVLKGLHNNGFPNVSIGLVFVPTLSEIQAKLQQLHQQLKWSLVLDKNLLLSELKIAQLKIKPIVYPKEIENSAISATYAKDLIKLRQAVVDFLNWWKQAVYQPEQIIEAFVRFASSIINVIKEMDSELFKQIKQHQILQRLMDSFTGWQLEATLLEFLNRLDQLEASNGPNYSPVIQRALHQIMEYYHTGITLEETAVKLRITPEYLSSLFNKEVGRNFSTYLKEFRINKARELLINSNLKVYEIAEKVGYSDPKYFCRVFKEVTGLSAGDYQKRLS
jgi:two-component system, response regulator YesN